MTPQYKTGDLVTFTKKILCGKLNLLCSVMNFHIVVTLVSIAISLCEEVGELTEGYIGLC